MIFVVIHCQWIGTSASDVGMYWKKIHLSGNILVHHATVNRLTVGVDIRVKMWVGK